MGFPEAIPTAITAIGLGLFLWVMVALILLRSRNAEAQGLAYLTWPVSIPLDTTAHNVGVMVADLNGGQVRFINEHAQTLFELESRLPTNLARLSRLVRPAGVLDHLLAAECQMHFTLGETHLEAESVRLPSLPATIGQMVVILRKQEHLPEITTVDANTMQGMELATEISRSIAANLDLEKTYEAILAIVARMMQYNVAEINLWNSTTGMLHPVRHAGDRDYPRALAQSGYYYKLDEGFTGWLANQRQALLIADIDDFAQAHPKITNRDFAFQSFLGVPLLNEDQLVGTLEVISYKPNAYKQNDKIILELIAGQAAIALRNALAFSEQQRRLAELSGLAEITRAIESTSDPHELYGRLTADIARFMQVHLVALLTYNPNEHLLVAQPPFYGLPDIITEIYRIPLPPDSAAEKLWLTQGYWRSNNTPTDPLVDTWDLRQVVETAGIQTTILAPIIIGGRRLGAIQVANKVDGGPFTDDDVRLLLIFAGQAGAILDNARLVREAQVRAEQAEGLRQIAATTASGDDIDAVLRTALQQTAKMIPFNYGMVALLDETRGELVPHLPSIYGGTADQTEAVRMSTDDPSFAHSVTRTRRPFITGRASTDRRIIGFYRSLVEHFQVESTLVVPLIVSERSIGEIMVSARMPRAFSRGDLRLLSTIASQVSSAIERVRLYTATDQSLQRRVEQLTALTRISRELNQTLELDHILHLVHDEAVRTTHATCGTIVLFDMDNTDHVVARRIGDEHLGQKLTMLEAEIASGEHSKRRVRGLRPDSPQTPHEGIRAALVVPIMVLGQIAGLIHLHSSNLEGFDETAEEAATALAAQTAIAVENTRRFEEQKKRGELLRRRADQLAQLFEISRSVRSDKSLATNLEAIAFGLQEAVGFNVVVINIINPQTRRYKNVATAGLPLATIENLNQNEKSWDDLARILRPEFRISQSYFLPNERAAHLINQIPTTVVLQSFSTEQVLANAWHEDDMLITPLRGSRQETLGLISVDDPRDGRRPDRNTIEIIEIFANQAAQAIENARLYEAAERRAAQLLALHRVIENATALTDRSQIWQSVLENLLGELPSIDIGVVALRNEHNQLVLRGRAGKIGSHVDLVPLLNSANPLTQVAQDGTPLLVTEIGGTEWALNPFVVATEIKSFVTIPIMSQGKVAGVLLVGAQTQRTPFAPEDLDVFTILANQLGASLDSARLEADIRQRAAQLGALVDVSQTITGTLRISDVVEAVLSPRGLFAVVPYESVTLWLREGDQLHIAAARGFENDAERVGLTVDIADSVLFAEMADKRAPILVADVRQDARFLPAGEFQPTRSWLGVPLVSKGRIIGALALDKTEAHYYTPQAAQILMAFANQMAVALDNARLFNESERRTRELDERSQRLALLNRVSAQLSGASQLNQVFSVTLTQIVSTLNVEFAFVLMFDHEGKPFITQQIPAQPMVSSQNVWNPVLERVRETLAPLAVANVTQEKLLASVQEPLLAREVKSLLVAPLVAGGTLVALLQLEETTEARHFTLDEIELVQTFANQAAVAAQNARLYDETQARLGELVTINHISRALSAALNREQLYQVIGEQVTAILGVDNIYVVLHDPSTNLLNFGLMISHGERRQVEAVPVSGLAGHILQTAQPLLLRGDDAEKRAQELGAKVILSTRAAKSYLGVPIILGGRAIGVIAIQDLERANSFDESHVRILTTVSAQVAVGLENARLFDETQSQLQEMTVVNDLSQALSTTLEIQQLYHILGEKIALAIPANAIQLALYDEKSNLMEYPILIENGAWVPVAPIPPRGLSAYICRTGEPLLLSGEALQQKAVEVGAAVLYGQMSKSYLGVPLLQGDRAIGVLAVQDTERENLFTESHKRILTTVAAQVAVVVQNARLFAQTQQRVAELATINRVSEALAARLEPEALIQFVGDQLRQIFKMPMAYVALYEAEQQLITFPYWVENDTPLAFPSLHLGQGLTSHVIRTRQPLIINQNAEEVVAGLQGVHSGGRPVKAYMGVPITVGDEVIGVMSVQTTERENAFSENDERLLSTIAVNVGVALKSARLFAQTQAALAERTRAEEQTRRRNSELEALNRVASTVNSVLDLATMLQGIAREMVQIFNARDSGIALLDPDEENLTVVADYNINPNASSFIGLKIPGHDNPSTEKVLATGETVVMANPSTHELAGPMQPVFEEQGMSCLMIVPLRARGRVIGTIGLETNEPGRVFTPEEVSLAETIAGQIAGGVGNAQFAQELENRVRTRTADLEQERLRVETLLLITTELSSSLDLDRVLARALQLVTDAVGAPRGSIFLLDLESDQVIYRAALGRDRPLPPGGEPAPFKRSEGLVGWVIRNRQSVVIGDVEKDPRWKENPNATFTPKSALGVPLMANEDALGAMILVSPKPYAFDDDQLRLVAAAANQVGAAINNAELYRLIRDQAERLGGMLRGQQVEATKSRAILEGIADGVLVTDANDQVILFNLACERILQLDRDKVIGRAASEFVGIYGPAGKEWLAATLRWSLEPSRYRPGDFVSQQITLDNGRVISIHLAPVLANEEYLGSVSVIRDITREVEVDRLKSEFVTNVSHELRTPLTSIKGYADLLLVGAGGPLAPDQSRFLDVIKSNADRLSMLVDDLLDISRIESGRVQLVLRPVAIEEVIREVVSTVQGRVDEEHKPMTIKTEIPAELPLVLGDRERLTQIIMNLADNAFSYSLPEGTIVLKAALAENQQDVVVEVSDSGVGIAPEDQKRLFDRFYRGENALVMATAGTGLGLAIAQQLTEMHHGRLWLKASTLDVGSTFALAIPVATGER